MTVVNAVHTAHDTYLLDLLATSAGRLQATMHATQAGPDRGGARALAGELIRQVDNITALFHPDPGADSVPDPWALEGFSLYRGSLLGAIPALWQRADELVLDWAIRVPLALREDEDSRAP